jgi:hypothetical protein
MESVDGLGAGLHQVAVLDDSAQSRGSSIDLGSAQSGGRQRSDPDRQRVGVVVFAAGPAREHSHPSGQLRRDIDHLDAIGTQQGSQRCPQTGGPFDGPAGVRPAVREPTQRPIAVAADRHTHGAHWLPSRRLNS